MNYFVYIIQSKTNQSFYIGQTADIQKRLFRHNAGYEKYTKKFIPWNLIWFNTFDSRAKAMKEEKRLKNMKSRDRLIKTINENVCVPGSVNVQISDLIHFRESS
jgi:putative endonuclease